MKGHLASLGPGPQAASVAQVAGHRLGAQLTQSGRRRFRAGQSPDGPALVAQALDEHPADKPGAAGDERAGHAYAILPGFMFPPGSIPSNSDRIIATPGAEMSCSSQRACSVPTAW
jgi:hypothetical protein